MKEATTHTNTIQLGKYTPPVQYSVIARTIQYITYLSVAGVRETLLHSQQLVHQIGETGPPLRTLVPIRRPHIHS